MAWSDLRPNTGSDDTNSVVPGSVIDYRPVLGDGRWRFGYGFPEFTIMPEKNPPPQPQAGRAYRAKRASPRAVMDTLRQPTFA
jgi:hypothetical protein